MARKRALHWAVAAINASQHPERLTVLHQVLKLPEPIAAYGNTIRLHIEDVWPQVLCRFNRIKELVIRTSLPTFLISLVRAVAEVDVVITIESQITEFESRKTTFQSCGVFKCLNDFWL